MEQLKIGDLVVISNPQTGYAHLRNKVAVVIDMYDELLYVEIPKIPMVSKDKELIYGHAEMKSYFGSNASDEHRIYLALGREIESITITKEVAEQLDWVYCVGDKLYKIPKDYFDGE